MSKIYFYNENCFDTMKRMKNKEYKADLVLTSPPYNTGRTCKTQRSIDNYENRYDIYLDNMTNEEYIDWTISLFNNYEKVLSKNGIVLYNISYGGENPNTLWLIISEIICKTDFMIADVITWKKNSALPNNVSSNKLTRITEFVFVICRKDEYKTFNSNKQVKSYSKTGQKYYENIFNYIEAKNNDSSCKLNKATYSTELCNQLLKIYALPNSIVYDSFMGTGTTAISCEELSHDCIGSEISEGQVQFSKDRLKEFRQKKEKENVNKS